MAKFFSKGKRVLAVIIALMMVCVACFTGMTTAVAESNSLVAGLTDVATVAKDGGMYTNYKTVADIDGGGITYTVANANGAYSPYVHNVSAGSFPGNGVRLQFANYASTATADKSEARGYRQFMITLATNCGANQGDNYRLVAGAGAFIVDTNAGKLLLVKGLNAGLSAHEVLQEVIESDVLKYDNITGKAFTVDFESNYIGGGIKATVTVAGSDPVSGVVTAENYEKISKLPVNNFYPAISSVDCNNPVPGLSMSIEYYGYKTGISTLPEVAQNLDGYATVANDATNDLSGGYYAKTNLPGGGVHYNCWQLSGYRPYAYNVNVGGYAAGFRVVFANYMDTGAADADDVTYASHGQFLLTLGSATNSDSYYKFKTNVIGININTVAGTVELVQSPDAGVHGHYTVLQTIITNDIFKYQNFTRKVFAYEFTKGTNGNIKLKMTVGDQTASGEIDITKWNNIADAGTASRVATSTSTYISFSAIGGDTANAYADVDFLGYTSSILPDEAKGLDEYASSATDAFAANAWHINTDYKCGGVHNNTFQLSGYAPYAYTKNVGGFQDGFKLVFANYTDRSKATDAAGGKGQFALMLSNSNANDEYYKLKPNVIAVNVNTIDGKVELIQSDHNSMLHNVVLQTIMADDMFKYENFTNKVFTYEFSLAENGIKLTMTVGNASKTGIIDLDMWNAISVTGTAKKVATPTTTFISFGGTINDANCGCEIDFYGYKKGITPDFIDNLDGVASVETGRYEPRTQGTGDMVNSMTVKDLAGGGVSYFSKCGGYVPYVYKQDLGGYNNGFKLYFSNFTDQSNTGTGYRLFNMYFLRGYGDDNYDSFKWKENTVALQINANLGKVVLAQATAYDLASSRELAVIAEDDAFKYANFTGKPFTVAMKKSRTVANATDITVTVAGKVFTKAVKTSLLTTLYDSNANPQNLANGSTAYVGFGGLTGTGNVWVGANFYGYESLADTELPDFAKGLDLYATTSTDKFTANNWHINTALPFGGVNNNTWQLSGYAPYAYTENVGGYDNGFKLVFDNYVDNGSATSVEKGKGQFLLMLSASNASDSYWKFKTNVVGVNINTVDGQVELVQSDNASMQHYIVLDTLIEDDAFLYDNFSGLPFTYTFTKGDAGINLKITVGDKSFKAVIDMADWNNLADTGTSSRVATGANTFISFGGTYNDSPCGCSVDFYGVKKGIVEPFEYIDPVENQDGSVTYPDGRVRITDKNLRFLGHWNKTAESIDAYFQAGLEIKFTGTKLYANYQGAISVSVDGGDWVSLAPGTACLASGLTDGNHKVSIVSKWQGNNVKFRYFTVDGGAKTLPADTNKSIVFIGDSITCGWNGGVEQYDSAFINTYAFKTAQALGFAVSGVAIAGIDVIDGDDSNSTDDLGMCSRFYRMGENGSDAQDMAFNPAYSEAPDYIVINIGINGYHASNDARVQPTYEAFLSNLRTTYPNAAIICMSPFMDKNVAMVSTSVANRNTAGDSNVYYIDAHTWTGYEPVKSGDLHPSPAGHTWLANKLIPEITNVLTADIITNIETAVGDNTIAIDAANDIKCASGSAYYANGTLGFACNIGDFAGAIPEGVEIVEYGMVFIRDALRTANGSAFAAGTNEYVGELTVGYSNTINDKTYSAITASKVVSDDTIPDSFIAVLKDRNNNNGNVSYGYYKTKYAARGYVKCFDAESGLYVYIYGNTVVKSGYEINPNLGITE